MKVKKEQIEGIYLGAMIHNIGKIYVPAEILSSPRKLTETEMDLIRAHSAIGFDIIKDIPFMWPIQDIVLQHHERLNGSGY